MSEVVIGVDVAYKGEDESVACERVDNDVLLLSCWRGNDTQESAGRVMALARQWQPVRINVDSIGYGAGVLDKLVAEGFPAVGVNVGEKARDDEHFYLRRSELFWGLRTRFETGDISLPEDSILLDQLTQLRFRYTPRGQIRLESKDEMREQRPAGTRWRSPDRADAVMLAFATAGNRWLPVAVAGEGVAVGMKEWSEMQ